MTRPHGDKGEMDDTTPLSDSEAAVTAALGGAFSEAVRVRVLIAV